MTSRHRVQYEDHPLFEAFEQWRVAAREAGIRMSQDGLEPAFFVPKSAVEDYFTIECTQGLVNAVCNTSRSTDPRSIRNHCLQVFCILLACGYGNYVHHFTQRSLLHDRYLPFDAVTIQQHLGLAYCEQLAAAFCEAQWEFCAQGFTDWQLNDDPLSDMMILPIIEHRLVDEGRSATVHCVRIHDDYNSFKAKKPRYALKHYTTDEGKRFYEKEKDAYVRISSIGNKSTRANIITYFSSFRQAETCNVLFEYADGGNLEQYLRRTPPPSSAKQIELFWGNFAKLFAGLRLVHYPDWIADGVLGWHHDIKPANILVVKADDSRYECMFKVADLGSSSFKRSGLAQETAIDTDSSGATRTYGPPECYQRGKDINKWPSQMRQDCDVWSLGAIFSEVAVWVALGMDGVESYRQRRRDATSRIQGFLDVGAFHGGDDVLPVVLEMHRDVITSLRRGDNYTEGILALIERYMLCVQRQTAKFLETRLDELLDHQPQGDSSPLINPPIITRPRSLLPDPPSNVPPSQHDDPIEPVRPAVIGLPSSLGPSNPKSRPPQLTFPVAKELIDSRKHRRRFSRSLLSSQQHLTERRDHFPHPENFNKIEGREIVFVVDNSASMSHHREDVWSLLRVLGGMAKGSDKDGPDLYLTLDMNKTNSANISDLLKVLRKAKYQGEPDITPTFERIFREKVYNSAQKKPVSIYVFTDGDWNWPVHFDPQLTERFKTLVAFLEAQTSTPLEKRHVGVQFIRFGTSEQGQSRLKFLDDGIAKELGRDIIDTTDFEGCCVWKILLGPTDNTWDDMNPSHSSSSGLEPYPNNRDFG